MHFGEIQRSKRPRVWKQSSLVKKISACKGNQIMIDRKAIITRRTMLKESQTSVYELIKNQSVYCHCSPKVCDELRCQGHAHSNSLGTRLRSSGNQAIRPKGKTKSDHFVIIRQESKKWTWKSWPMQIIQVASDKAFPSKTKDKHL